MPRGFRFRWFHAVLLLLWLGLVALDWPDLVSGPARERVGSALYLVVIGWAYLMGQLYPDPADADETRRVMRVHAVVNVVLLVAVVLWVRWESVAGDRDLRLLVLAVLPVVLLVGTLWQYARADRSAARARERAAVAPPAG